MSGAYAYTPTILPLLLGAILLLITGLYSWQRRATPGARWLAAGSFLSCLMTLCTVLAMAAVSLAAKTGWQSFQLALLLPIVAATTCFALEYTSGGRWLTRHNFALVWTPAFIGLLAILATGGEVLGPVRIDAGGAVVRTASTFSKVFLAYGTALLLVNSAAFLWLFAHSPQHRWPVALMLAAQVAGRGAAAVGVFSSDLPVSFSLATASAILVWTTYAIALFGFRIFDPLPAARLAVIEQMRAGVVVFDAGWRVLSLNPAAEAILGVGAGAARHKTWPELGSPERLLPALPDFPGQAKDGAIEFPDVTFKTGSEARYYAPALSTLTDFRGLAMGHLLILRDVTERRRGEAERLERQRIEATLSERERLARELHDSIGQVMGYANFQVGSAAKLSRDGHGVAAATQLDRLGEILRDAHTDLREHILNLRSTAALGQPFFPTIGEYLEGYASSYGMQIRLEIDPPLLENNFAPELDLELFRIVQEALSNARRHGRARHVEVRFTRQGRRLHVSIQDDGVHGVDIPAR